MSLDILYQIEKQNPETGLWDIIDKVYSRQQEKLEKPIQHGFLWFKWEQTYVTKIYTLAELRIKARKIALENSGVIRITQYDGCSGEYGESWWSFNSIIWKNGNWV